MWRGGKVRHHRR
jgi:hypothetical protein